MCRFYSGFFYQQELLKKYDYYWRVESDVDFYCDIDFDPFVYIKENDIKYGFTLVLYEEMITIPTLWDTVKNFIRTFPHSIENDSIIEFITDDNGANFEIADLNLWRGEAYTKFFNFLDKTGRFFYEWWRDAPIHTIAAALFLKKHQVHFFEEIGYHHRPFLNCPKGNKFQHKCLCNPDDSMENNNMIGKKSDCILRYHRFSPKTEITGISGTS
ncbi:glycosyltransferase family 15 protein [Gigaspora margarita]|uniref:Glycosyltransferase family 15 protein n=1 Tax=Gigaspora margarita TaxID=4874 RepID=A0A8H3X483_GIGMA|nr:glycosyltransferase family 15 protein [Gigaspora margarita]